MGSLFIEPSGLPGGQAWASACAGLVPPLPALANATHAAAHDAVFDALGCGVSARQGLAQVLLLLCVYGGVLYKASELIANGSELLLLVPSLRGIVGSIVLPVLGAVPDGAIVLFSGLGANAQEEVAVGVGALAGSTSMLLTVPWFLSIVAGRVNIRGDGVLSYHSTPKLFPPGNASLNKTGVEPMKMVSISGRIMIITALSYVVIQAAAFHTGNFFAASATVASTTAAAAQERNPALLCFVVSMSFFCWYLYYQLNAPEDEAEYRETVVDEVKQKAIRAGTISLSAAHKEIWSAAHAADENTHLVVEEHKKSRLSSLLKVFFNHYDDDHSKTIDASELHGLMTDLGERLTFEEVQDLHKQMDTDGSNTIEFEEFVNYMPEFIRSRAGQSAATRTASGRIIPPADLENSTADGLEEEEEEEVPHDLRDEDPSSQIRKVMRRSFSMMAFGTLLVLIFSDPMVAVLNDVGRRIGVPAFYISFVLAPLASNASELIAAYTYALKKTRKTVTISFSTLLGAAILNNTFVLAIFMLLISVKGLAWQFTAETISILFVELFMAYMSQKKVQRLKDAYIVLAMYPLSLFIVFFLENVIGLD